MIRDGGLTLPEMFDRVRLRVSEMTQGAEVPWDTQKIEGISCSSSARQTRRRRSPQPLG